MQERGNTRLSVSLTIEREIETFNSKRVQLAKDLHFELCPEYQLAFRFGDIVEYINAYKNYRSSPLL